MSPSCFQPVAYDPHAPLRTPRSRRSTDECTADMAACMQQICAMHGQDCVTEADLLRAGFTPGEVERCHAGAATALMQRIVPRDIAEDRFPAKAA